MWSVPIEKEGPLFLYVYTISSFINQFDFVFQVPTHANIIQLDSIETLYIFKKRKIDGNSEMQKNVVSQPQGLTAIPYRTFLN